MATTTNFGWETPDDTDLVKDGALAIRTLGSAIDTSLVDLKGGTTGQVLSKTSNTDMDFTWVTSDDANAIQNAIVDAKGDLIAASAADTPARLAVGSNGDTLVADSAASTGLRWQGNYAAGKNAIINGDFFINQRGFSSTTTSGIFGFDRWFVSNTGGTATYSAQTFTLGTAPVSGYEGKNFARVITSGQSAASDVTIFRQYIESARTFAGRTVTVSFWAKAASGTPKVAVELAQYGGDSGGSIVNTYAGQVTLSTSWARYSVTASVPSLSGFTFGTVSNDALRLNLFLSAGSDFNTRTGSLGIQSATFDFWGVQVEAGSVATAFQTATGTIQGELDAAMRYYQRFNAQAYTNFGIANAPSTTAGSTSVPLLTAMRTTPTSIDYAGSIRLTDQVANFAVTALTLITVESSPQRLQVTATSTGLTQYRMYFLSANNDATAYLGVSAEL